MTDLHSNSLTITADASRLKELRDWTRQQLMLCQYDENMIESVVLAIGEAAMNVVQHSFGGGDTKGELSLEITADGDDLIFRITDNAPVIDPTTINSRNLEQIRPGGLGIHFINSLMDTVEYRPLPQQRGNLLIMKKRVSRAC
ncbi:MAG: ATP-binding protein [Candidatus Sedimenticola sp. (ex Thyasira tokunagai)]